MARPRKFTDEKDRQLRAILRMKPTLQDCAAYLELNSSTIEKHIKKTYGVSFSVFREQNMVHTRFGLIRTCIQQANSGNTAALIFALKNVCGWTDKHNIEATGGLSINYDIAKKDDKKG